MSEPTVEFVLRDDGRRVAVHRLVDGDVGRTLVLCHPAPGAGTLDPDPEQTRARGATLLAVDRPGYGQSDPAPETDWTGVDSAADDLAAVLDRLDRGPVGIAGWAAGGWVALALAARHPDLVDRVVMLNTPAPQDQVPWLSPEQQQIIEGLRGYTASMARMALSAQLAPLIPPDLSAPEALSLLAMNAADDAALATLGARDRLHRMLAAAFAQGAVGWAGDIAGYSLRPWGFTPAQVQAKTLLLYGSQDPLAGPRHGSWWQRKLPHARLEVAPGAGHLLILTHWKRALSHLAPKAKRQRP